MSQSLGADAVAPTRVITPPHGLDQIVTTFGNIFDYIREDHTLDPEWQAEALQQVPLPFALPLSWDRSRTVQRISCHKLLAQTCADIFLRIQSAGLQGQTTSFGGCFAFRPQRTGAKLSTHAWGIALDLNPESNAQGTAGNMNPRVVAIFKEVGFAWGGEWQGSKRDAIHFQFVTGY